MNSFSNLGKTYGKPTINSFHGFVIRRQHDVKLANGRARTTLYLYCGGKKVDESVVTERKGISFENSVAEKTCALVKKNRVKILDLVHDGTYTGLTLDGFYFLVDENVAVSQKWLRNAVTFRKIWADTLCNQVGNFKLLDENLLEKLENTPALSASRERHREISDEEIRYRRFLGGLLRYAEQDGLIEKGISAAILKNTKTHESTAVLIAHAKRTFSCAELNRFVELCLSRDEPEYRAILLHLLTGMTIAAVCGLNIGDHQSYQFPGFSGEVIYWLSITKEYEQTRDGKPKLSYLLDSSFAYRRFPCTEVVNSIVMRQKCERKKTDPVADNEAPLFVGKDGRLTPNEVKVVKEQLIEEAILSPIDLSIGRGSKKGRFRGDFLRANAEYYFRYSALLNNQETRVLLGISPTQTYAIHYADWSYPYVLVMLREKLERWHRQFSNAQNVCSSPAQNYQTTVISGTACKDTVILIRSAHGVSLTIKPLEGEKGA